MTPTSKERREVAERLREYGNDTLKDGSLLKTLKDVTGAGSWRYVLDALAELIDPTCNIDVIDTGERADYDCREHIMRCQNCGAEFGYVLYGEDGDVSMDDKPLYCPNCGARVMR